MLVTADLRTLATEALATPVTAEVPTPDMVGQHTLATEALAMLATADLRTPDMVGQHTLATADLAMLATADLRTPDMVGGRDLSFACAPIVTKVKVTDGSPKVVRIREPGWPRNVAA